MNPSEALIELASRVSTETSVVEMELAAVSKDNDTVYFMVIPELEQLETAQGVYLSAVCFLPSTCCCGLAAVPCLVPAVYCCVLCMLNWWYTDLLSLLRFLRCEADSFRHASSVRLLFVQ
jgi:hypothetical protein